MPQIINLTATTELEAVNAMLSGIGEAPVANVDTAVTAQQDVAMAVAILRNITREILRHGWRFNSEYGWMVPLATGMPFAWTDADGTALNINVFPAPVNLASFQLSATTDQVAAGLDLVIRPSSTYKPAGSSVLVFYDRVFNRDGLDSTKYAKLQIDPVWYFNFEQCPESLRAYATVRAARQFAEELVGSAERSKFKEKDEVAARRELFRDQSPQYDMNILNEPSVLRILGDRPRYLGGGYNGADIRYYP